MIYARVHDQTISDDYYAAMSRVEQRLQVSPKPEPAEAPVSEAESMQILALAEQLAAPEAEPEQRRGLLEQMRTLILGTQIIQQPAESRARIPPPRVSAAVD